MGIAATIAGLVQEGTARGYNLFAAARYADDRLDPGIAVTGQDLIDAAIELNRRMPHVATAAWQAILAMELGHRVVEPPPGDAYPEAGLPSWTWPAVALGGALVLYLAWGKGR